MNQKEITIDFWTRVFSGLIDIVFYIAVFSTVAFLNSGSFDDPLPETLSWIPISVYVLLFHAYYNQTPGMKVMGYKFVNASDSTKPAFWKMILRWIIAFILRLTTLGALIAFFTFRSDSGFYWDRWFRVKVVSSGRVLF